MTLCKELFAASTTKYPLWDIPFFAFIHKAVMNTIIYKAWKYLWLYPQDKCLRVELLGKKTGCFKASDKKYLTPAQKAAGKGNL